MIQGCVIVIGGIGSIRGELAPRAIVGMWIRSAGISNVCCNDDLPRSAECGSRQSLRAIYLLMPCACASAEGSFVEGKLMQPRTISLATACSARARASDRTR